MPDPAPAPYRTTPVFDENSLPAALTREHSTKAGVWGVIRILEGRLRLVHLEPAREEWLSPALPGLILPEEVHYVQAEGPMKMQVEFYDRPPILAQGDRA